MVYLGDNWLLPAESGQIPIAVLSLRPSHILFHGFSDDIDAVDRSFCELVRSWSDPTTVQSCLPEAKKSLGEMLRLYL